MQANLISKVGLLVVLFASNNFVHAAIPVMPPQLKLSVYWGEDPAVVADNTVISTNSQDFKQAQTLYVEDGETVSLAENRIIKLTKAVGGGQQQAQKKEYRDVDSMVVADGTQNIIEIKHEIAKLKQDITSAKEAQLQQALNTQLSAATKKLAMLQAKQASLAKSNTDVQKQSNYDEANGIALYDFVDLPAGIYLKPKMLNEHQVRVEINIIKADPAVGKAVAGNVKTLTKQIKTTLGISLNQWQKIAGQEDISSNKEQVITYSTASNTESNKVWLKIELAD